jgi:hypothetical protein
MPSTSTTAASLHYTAKPNRTAVQALQDAYAGYTTPHRRQMRRPWTVAEMLVLGKLYVAAWHAVPTPSRLRAHWCMPDSASVVKAFGSYQAFYAQISEEGAAYA